MTVRFWSAVSSAIIALASIAFSPPVHAQDVHSHCIEVDLKPAGDCVITQPKILNVYWDTSAPQWDIDATVANSRERIDAHVLALTRSSYFSQLGQYHIAAPEFLGSITSAGCQAPQTRRRADSALRRSGQSRRHELAARMRQAQQPSKF